MVNMMREHVPQDTRIHYVITNGGKAPNVVPDFAELFIYARQSDMRVLDQIWQWIINASKGAAMAPGITQVSKPGGYMSAGSGTKIRSQPAPASERNVPIGAIASHADAVGWPETRTTSATGPLRGEISEDSRFVWKYSRSIARRRASSGSAFAIVSASASSARASSITPGSAAMQANTPPSAP